MPSFDLADLPPPQRIAVAYTPHRTRPMLAALLALDTRLARSLSGTQEPLLAQMRLAWWREELAIPTEARAAGEPVLCALGKSWRGREADLIALVDGWEYLLGEAPLAEEAIAAFAAGRGTGFATLAECSGAASAAGAAARAGRRWALADLAFRVSDPTEQIRCRALYDEIAATERLPATLRGVAVLDGLARRAMARGEPPMTGRGGALSAMRLGMFGR